MAKKPQVILEIKTYVDGKLIDQTAKVIEPPPDWIRRIILAVIIPVGFWIMAMQGVFR